MQRLEVIRMIETRDHNSIKELMDSSIFIFFKWRNSPGWPVEFVSKNTTQLLGYPPEAFEDGTISYSDIIHPKDLPNVTEEVGYYSKEGVDQFTHKPYRIFKSDGSIIWVHDATRIIRDKEGNITHYIGYITDITALKERELALQFRTKNLEKEIEVKTEAIREQKRIFKTLVDNSADGILILKNERFISCNPATVSLLEYSSHEELLALHPGQISPKFQPDGEPSGEKASRMIRLALEKGRHRFEWQYLKKDGTPIWFDITLTRIYISGEEMVYANMHPIDNLKKMQQQLQALNASLQEDMRIQKSLYEELFNSTRDGIILFKEGEILDSNEAILRLLGLKDRERMKEQLPSLVALEEKFDKALREGHYNFEYEIVRPSGSSIWLEVTLMPMRLQGEQIIHSHWRDITKRKRLEVSDKTKTEQLVRQSRLAQMGEMISMIAHQWRQPLGAISATITAMQTKMQLGKIKCQTEKEGEANAYLLERFNKIHEYVQYLSQTIDDFRNFFKPDKAATCFSLAEAVERTLSMIEQNLYSHGIEVRFEKQDLPPIHCYENEVVQVLLNLIKNAEDALIERKISQPVITISLRDEGEMQSIIIEDNAGGIPEETVERIFDPYFSTKSKNGTGLGLYMSKTIIEEHCHGRLNFANTGEGARFTVTLPVSIREAYCNV